MMTLNELAAQCHQDNLKWWTDYYTGDRIERNSGELFALMHSELSEALEGERCSTPDHPKMDDHLPHRPMAEVEMADVIIRILDWSAANNVSLIDNSSAGWIIPDNRGEAINDLHRHLAAISNYRGNVDRGSSISEFIWRVEAYCKKFGYDLWGAYQEKRLYNHTRADHSHANRMAEGGKKF